MIPVYTSSSLTLQRFTGCLRLYGQPGTESSPFRRIFRSRFFYHFFGDSYFSIDVDPELPREYFQEHPGSVSGPMLKTDRGHHTDLFPVQLHNRAGCFELAGDLNLPGLAFHQSQASVRDSWSVTV